MYVDFFALVLRLLPLAFDVLLSFLLFEVLADFLVCYNLLLEDICTGLW